MATTAYAVGAASGWQENDVGLLLESVTGGAGRWTSAISPL
jgi:hypothetical protein